FNRVAGYCLPSQHDGLSPARTAGVSGEGSSQGAVLQDEYEAGNAESMLSRETRMEVISAIPCYCDIQFSRKEFLTALRYPTHPFTKEMEMLTNAMATKL